MKSLDQESLFPRSEPAAIRANKGQRAEKTKERLERLDANPELRERLLRYCRLRSGEVWEDPARGHRVGVLDATSRRDVSKIMPTEKARLIVNDPPYNVIVGNTASTTLSKVEISSYLDFSRAWVETALSVLDNDAHLYVWMGADYKDNFQPLPDFMILMREFHEQARARNFITLRNQRGYGTQRNWMWIRQELLYYVKGNPAFDVDAEYTDIPKILRGYYKEVNGQVTENLERSKSENIRAGNVWVDIQQVFYRLEENVPGCYAQKPLKAIERIVRASTAERELVADFFSHSGTTLIAGERLNRRVFTFDIDPIFAEITIRRLEHYRKTGKVGWQWASPFPEVTLEERVR
jgi:site-specific DNA-methyltransferase (adenine-specific)